MVEKNLPELPKLPNSWVWARLAEIGDVVTGTTPRKSEEDFYGVDYSFFKPTDLKAGYYVRKSDDGLSKVGIKKARLLPPKSILTTCIGATIGKTGFIRNHGASNQQINAIVANPSVCPEFIYFMVISPHFQKSIIDNSSATTLPIINKSKFENLLLPIPPFQEQHRIVSKIEELFSDLDAGVEALKKAKAQLKLYRQAVLKAAFEGRLTTAWREDNDGELESANVLLEHIKNRGKEIGVNESNLPALPEKWVWARIGEISDKIHYGYTESSTTEPIGPKFLRITDIQDNSVNWDSVPYCSIKADETQKYLLKDGDLVFARTGATVGKSFLITGNIPPAVFASYLIRIILNDLINREYVYNYFQSLSYWEQIHDKKLGIGQPNVNGQILSQIILPLPPASEQERITKEIERCFSLADAVEQALNNGMVQSDRLRQSILKKAFSGELVSQDPEDEPAAVLLERIRREKATQAAGKKPGRRAAQRDLNYG